MLGVACLESASAKLSSWAVAVKGTRRKEGAGDGRRVAKGAGERDEEERLSDDMMLPNKLTCATPFAG